MNELDRLRRRFDAAFKREAAAECLRIAPHLCRAMPPRPFRLQGFGFGLDTPESESEADTEASEARRADIARLKRLRRLLELSGASKAAVSQAARWIDEAEGGGGEQIAALRMCAPETSPDGPPPGLKTF